MSELENYRTQIDAIDKELVRLLGERFQVVKSVGRYKKLHNMEALQKERWEALMQGVLLEAQKQNVPPGCAKEIWNSIHKAALSLENNL